MTTLKPALNQKGLRPRDSRNLNSASSFEVETCPESEGIATELYSVCIVLLCLIQLKPALNQKGLRLHNIRIYLTNPQGGVETCPESEGIATGLVGLDILGKCVILSWNLPWIRRDCDNTSCPHLLMFFSCYQVETCPESEGIATQGLPEFKLCFFFWSWNLPWIRRDCDRIV